MPHIDKAIAAKEAAGETYIAFEFYPPRTADGVANLYKRFDRMVQQSERALPSQAPPSRTRPTRAPVRASASAVS